MIVALIVFIFSITWNQHPGVDTCHANDPCQQALAALTRGEELTVQSLRQMGFEIDNVQNFERAIVRPMPHEQWTQVQGGVNRSMRGYRDSVNNMHAPNPNLSPPRATLTALPGGGRQLEGSRYIVIRSGDQRRIFKFEFREIISHDGQNITHFASTNITEISATGERIGLVAYADSPHIDRLGAKWFHGHSGRTGEVVTQIQTTGFTESAMERMYSWASSFVRQTIGAGR